ncbi:hypothetical protein OF83DRAFT_1084760 [Amylostereum chailletii]|nr:hypothetical protein OF83DRAFT_1084760 [Amylostereum chailletii]
MAPRPDGSGIVLSDFASGLQPDSQDIKRRLDVASRNAARLLQVMYANDTVSHHKARARDLRLEESLYPMLERFRSVDEREEELTDAMANREYYIEKLKILTGERDAAVAARDALAIKLQAVTEECDALRVEVHIERSQFHDEGVITASPDLFKFSLADHTLSSKKTSPTHPPSRSPAKYFSHCPLSRLPVLKAMSRTAGDTSVLLRDMVYYLDENREAICRPSFDECDTVEVASFPGAHRNASIWEAEDHDRKSAMQDIAGLDRGDRDEDVIAAVPSMKSRDKTQMWMGRVWRRARATRTTDREMVTMFWIVQGVYTSSGESPNADECGADFRGIQTKGDNVKTIIRILWVEMVDGVSYMMLGREQRVKRARLPTNISRRKADRTVEYLYGPVHSTNPCRWLLETLVTSRTPIGRIRTWIDRPPVLLSHGFVDAFVTEGMPAARDPIRIRRKHKYSSRVTVSLNSYVSVCLRLGGEMNIRHAIEHDSKIPVPSAQQ